MPENLTATSDDAPKLLVCGFCSKHIPISQSSEMRLHLDAKHPHWRDSVVLNTSLIAPSDWASEGRCVYLNAPRFLGQDMEGVSADQHQAMVDKAFLADDKWSPGEESHGLRLAIKECLQCPVRRQCLAANLEEEYGVFGATTNWERKMVLNRKLIPDLSTDERLLLLETIVAAKSKGLGPESFTKEQILQMAEGFEAL